MLITEGHKASQDNTHNHYHNRLGIDQVNRTKLTE